MNELPRETAVIVASQLYRDPFAKTAHGLVRGPCRYRIVGIIDSSCAGEDAGFGHDHLPLLYAGLPVHGDGEGPVIGAGGRVLVGGIL